MRDYVGGLAEGEIATSITEIQGFRTNIQKMVEKVGQLASENITPTQVGEMGAEVEELTRDRGNSILVHGLPVQQAECLENLVKLMSDLIRTRLGIGREMVLVSINRLKPTK